MRRVTVCVATLCAVAMLPTLSAQNLQTGTASEPRQLPVDQYPATYSRYPGVTTLLKGATVFDGAGGRIENGSVLFAEGRIVAIGRDIAAPAGAVVIEAEGKWVTPGIIDVHSHIGASVTPVSERQFDQLEMSSPTTPQVWVEHSIWVQDPAFSRALTNGAVTTMQLLPGSVNVMGGRSIVVKNVYARTVQQMKIPGAPNGLKMACGENPKRYYAGRGQAPTSRMGIIALDRQMWAKAVEYRRDWDRYVAEGGRPPTRDLGLDTLASALRGHIAVQAHCYRSDDMANMIEMSHEFGFRIAAFHHAVEAYKIADLLRANGICVATWADWWGAKMEMYDAVWTNAARIHQSGGCAIIHSDSTYGGQRLNQEAAKAVAAGRRAGITIADEAAWSWLSLNPAKALGIADRTGSLAPGKMADVVLWNGNPFSVYSRPEKVWIDGALLSDALDPRRRPISDFDLGQPGSEERK